MHHIRHLDKDSIELSLKMQVTTAGLNRADLHVFIKVDLHALKSCQRIEYNFVTARDATLLRINCDIQLIERNVIASALRAQCSAQSISACINFLLLGERLRKRGV